MLAFVVAFFRWLLEECCKFLEDVETLEKEVNRIFGSTSTSSSLEMARRENALHNREQRVAREERNLALDREWLVEELRLLDTQRKEVEDEKAEVERAKEELLRGVERKELDLELDRECLREERRLLDDERKEVDQEKVDVQEARQRLLGERYDVEELQEALQMQQQLQEEEHEEAFQRMREPWSRVGVMMDDNGDLRGPIHWGRLRFREMVERRWEETPYDTPSEPSTEWEPWTGGD